MSFQKTRGIGWLLFMILIMFFAFLFFAIYTIKSASDGTQLAELGAKNIKDLIGVVEVKGVIMESQKVVENLISAEKNPKVKAIILRVESPGGAVAPTQEIYQEILRIDKIKPVYASMGTMATSGGYYVAAATRKIYANPGTLTGSIGVLMQFMDLSKLYDFVKIAPETLKSGDYKDAGNPSRALTTKEKELLNSVIKGVHQQFVNDILRVRKDRIVGDLTAHAQGQLFSGESARKAGLIDQEASLWEAGREIHRELKLQGDFQLLYVKIQKKGFSLMNFLDSVEESSSSIKQLLSLKDIPLFLYRNDLNGIVVN
ncbi:MAG: signal peptide peptidase SppA [Oligoflexia bacterium]|nr:signal peptide peptidase SppA [Oligoflexia bacterium]